MTLRERIGAGIAFAAAALAVLVTVGKGGAFLFESAVEWAVRKRFKRQIAALQPEIVAQWLSRLDTLEDEVAELAKVIPRLSTQVEVIEQKVDNIGDNVKLLLTHTIERPVVAPPDAYRAPGATERTS